MSTLKIAMGRMSALEIKMENFSTNKKPANGDYLIRHTDLWMQQDRLIVAECLDGQFYIKGVEVKKQEKFISGFCSYPVDINLREQKEPTPTERLQSKLSAAVWICSFGELCGIKAKHRLTDIPLDDIHVRKEAAELLISVLIASLKALPHHAIEQIETQQQQRLAWLYEEPVHSESTAALSPHQSLGGEGSNTHQDQNHHHPTNTSTDI